MTPAQLLAREPVRVETDFHDLEGHAYNHLSELGFSIRDLKETWAPRIEVRVYGYRQEDSRRYWKLAAVYFNWEPVMIVQNAGREGDDHHARFMLNPDLYYRMLRVIAALPRSEAFEDQSGPGVLMDEDIEGLDQFYGERLQ